MCNCKEEKNSRGMNKYAKKGCDEVLKVPRLHQIVRDARKVNSRVFWNNNANAEQDNHENNVPDTVEMAVNSVQSHHFATFTSREKNRWFLQTGFQKFYSFLTTVLFSSTFADEEECVAETNQENRPD
jgi:hypothetical protein